MRRGDASRATNRFRLIKSQLILGGLEAVLNCPAMALDCDQCLDGGSGWAPCGEESHVSIGNVATDQQSTRPKSAVFLVVIGSIDVGQFIISPVVQARTLGAVTRREALPAPRVDLADDLLRRTGHRRLALFQETGLIGSPAGATGLDHWQPRPASILSCAAHRPANRLETDPQKPPHDLA